MSEKKWKELEDFREPPMRRAIEAMHEIEEEEEQKLLDEAVIAAAQLKKSGGDGGQIPQ
jgi:hypothetical protein